MSYEHIKAFIQKQALMGMGTNLGMPSATWGQLSQPGVGVTQPKDTTPPASTGSQPGMKSTPTVDSTKGTSTPKKAPMQTKAPEERGPGDYNAIQGSTMPLQPQAEAKEAQAVTQGGTPMSSQVNTDFVAKRKAEQEAREEKRRKELLHAQKLAAYFELGFSRKIAEAVKSTVGGVESSAVKGKKKTNPIKKMLTKKYEGLSKNSQSSHSVNIDWSPNELEHFKTGKDLTPAMLKKIQAANKTITKSAIMASKAWHDKREANLLKKLKSGEITQDKAQKLRRSWLVQ